MACSLMFRAVLGLAALSLVACGGGGGDGPPRVEASTTAIALAASIHDPPRDTSVFLQASGAQVPLWVEWDHTSIGVDHVTFETFGEDARIRIYLKAFDGLGPGLFEDAVTIRVCRDEACTVNIAGSPMEVAVTLFVTGGEPFDNNAPAPNADASLPALPVTGQQALGHDVVDAEYSDVLDAIVLVSSYPSSMLFVYDVANGVVQSLALDAPPTAVSVSPDGLTAAVGHDQVITLVDLANLDDPLVDPATSLDVTTNPFDIVLAGNGYVHAFPRDDQHENVRSIEIATNEETLAAGIYERARAKLHPSGAKIYATETPLSPSKLRRHDVTSGTAALGVDSPYHGQFEVCGNLWLAEGGAHIYTACGHVFQSSDVGGEDMVHATTLELLQPHVDIGSRIKALSHSTERGEVVLLEEQEFWCQDQVASPNCHTRLGVYGSDPEVLARYALAPVTVGGQGYRQRGIFLLHSADGGERYLISRLWGLPDPAQAFLLGSVDVPGPEDAAPQ